MSDYTKTTNFTAKDNLTTGNSLKVIKGSYFDTEFDAIATASATKYDSGNLASQAESEAGTDNTVLQTPLRSEQHIANYNAENGGLLLDIHGLGDPGGDRLLGWDESANDTILFTVGVGLLFTTTDLDVNPLLAGTGMTMTSSVLNVIGGDGMTANANDIALTAQSVSSTVPISIASGVLGWDSTSITEIDGTSVSQSADGYLLDNAGVLNVVPYDRMGLVILSADAAQTFAITDANSINILTGSTNRIWTIPANSAVAFALGTIILCQNSGTGDLTITADTGVIIDSIFHAAAATAQSDRVLDGGTAVLIKTATDTWALSGDIATS